MAQVDANLMRASGLKAQAHMGMRGESAHDPIMGHRWTPVRNYCHPLAFDRMSANRGVNPPAAGHYPMNKRHIFAGNLPRLELRTQGMMCRQAPRHD